MRVLRLFTKENNFKLARTSAVSDEMLIALSISSIAISGQEECPQLLHGCDAYFSSIIPSIDESIYLGINVCCEPILNKDNSFW